MSTPLGSTPSSTAHTDMSVGSADVLPRSAATNWPHRAALRSGPRTVTFAELDDAISRLALGLRRRIGGDGLPVVVSAVLGTDFPTAFFAVLRSGNVAVPVNPRMPTDAFAGLLDTTHAGAVVLGRVMYQRVRPMLAAHRSAEQVLLLDAPADAGHPTCAELSTGGTLLVEPRDRDENEFATLDERGRPGLTHRALKARAARGALAAGLDEHSVVLNAMPAHQLTHLCAGIAAGATQVLYGNPDPAAAVREASAVGATHLCRSADTGTVRTGHTKTVAEVAS
ncbi:MAG TPA: class I adenylate-forming enzyme family protein [Actinophytocola sp.]|nr:class I adenylate-forming enzyme family protein [Actinophytocola sp.]